MVTTSGLAEIAALAGDPARAAMLVALMDGRALTAGELAGVAGITPQTASGHLARLVAAGLLALERQGRHRYHRLAAPAVAQMVEGMMAVAAGARDARRRPPRTGPADEAMRQARSCYDHLAGRLAVAIADRLVERGHVELSPDGGAVTAAGAAFLATIGVDLDQAAARARGKRLFCRPCLDWSERRPHLAGAIGAALLDALLGQGWLRRTAGSRAIQITPGGAQRLEQAFGWGALPRADLAPPARASSRHSG
jgi:DNA-binding transcriptional ArsR family regulator